VDILPLPLSIHALSCETQNYLQLEQRYLQLNWSECNKYAGMTSLDGVQNLSGNWGGYNFRLCLQAIASDDVSLSFLYAEIGDPYNTRAAHSL
jgi:hypothetical protein